MAALPVPILRDELLGRRRRLERVGAAPASAADVSRLLAEVDAALARMDDGTYGLCETCHDPIESARLLADPLTRYCLDHLTPAEARALQQDLDLASRVQRGLLPPREASIDGWEAAHHYQPAGAVSGDYCDLIRADNGDAYFLLGDVAGKGVSAAMLMSHLAAMLRTLVPAGLPLGQLMARASSVFCESTLPMHYATLVCGRATPAGEIELCNAGHLPPLLVGAGGVTTVEATGLPIGMFCATTFMSVTLRPARGETLLLYTDGLVEAENADEMDYGLERLHRFVASAPRTPRALVDACVRDVTTFRGRSQFADDLTVLAVTRR